MGVGPDTPGVVGDPSDPHPSSTRDDHSVFEHGSVQVGVEPSVSVVVAWKIFHAVINLAGVQVYLPLLKQSELVPVHVEGVCLSNHVANEHLHD